MIVFYALPVSNYSAKVRIALQAKNVPYQEREPPDGYRSEAWRALQPTGTLPAIDDHGFLLAESEAIIEYLEDRYPEPPLLPGSARDRATARFLARFHDLHLEPRVRALFPLVRPARRDATRLAEALDGLRARVALLARIARPQPYLAGAALSVADCGFAVTVPLALRLCQALDTELSLPGAIARWRELVQTHPAVDAGLAPWRAATERWIEAQYGAE